MQRLALSGDLQEFGIEEVLALLARGATGFLTVERANKREEVRIRLIKGAIVDAEHFGIPLLDLYVVLNDAGYITTERLQEISILSLQDRRRRGALLVGLGLISQDVFEGYLRLQAKNALRQLFTWQEGSFSLRRNPAPISIGPWLDLKIDEVIAEGNQYGEEWESLKTRIDSLDCVVQLSGQGTEGSPDLASPSAEGRVYGAVDGSSSIRMIAQRLFLDDLETARAVDRLLALGRVELTECQPASAGESYRPAEGARDEEALASILSGSHRSPSNKANKAGERIKALIRELQDCLNDIARFHDGFYRASKGTGQVTVVEEYLDQQFGDLLATVQKEYPALGALQGANRRVDANDLIETYDLILGDTRQTFYTEAIQGLSALIKTVFDWALGSSQLDGEAECREAWQAFSRAVGAKLDEFAVAEGWGNRTGHQRA